MGFIDKLMGNTSESKLKKIRGLLKKINELEPTFKALSDVELRAKTEEFKKRVAEGETLDSLLCEAFAAVREGAFRATGMRPFDVQILGGIVLHQGRIAEMKTGEGKTLVAVMPAYLNALTGKGVYIVTVNDYLASRDAQWMGKIHKFMGLTVGCIIHDLDPAERQAAYNCDITYGTNNEFGFDYLRDNMAFNRKNIVQRELNYAIVDEVDSILIDEARTPLIISGMAEKSNDLYKMANNFVRGLTRGEDIQKRTRGELLSGQEEQPESGDYMVDVKMRTVLLTQQGISKAETYFGVDDISSPELTQLNHHIHQALKARALFTLDKDYIVADDQVIIVDEFTGRLMYGRRYSDGLHQALEAKEGVEIKNEDKTLATITFQNYFRMFNKLAGMTGTAKTEEEEFQGIYMLDVVEIPTNKPIARTDYNDCVFATEANKFNAVVTEIEKVHATGQPILVGTISVEKSEQLSRMLKNRGIKHQILNAKHHAREAEIVAQAGKFGNVTIATNMAGRGTDILLGGNPEYMARRELMGNGMDPEMVEESTTRYDTDNPEILAAREQFNAAFEKFKVTTDAEHEQVVKAGGLHIIGTERHESRRIDNQLRGRAGRQGDPGSTRFYVSFEDELMRRFGGERIKELLTRMNPEPDVPIEAGILTKQIESAQKRVEAFNYESRKTVLEYDDVMNKMREIIYSQRRSVLTGEDISEDIKKMIIDAVDARIHTYCMEGTKSSEWDIGGLQTSIGELCGFKPKCVTEELKKNEFADRLRAEVMDRYAKREAEIMDIIKREGAEGELDMREIERRSLLNSVNMHWMDHIDAMDQLRQGIGLRSIGQKDPLIAYRNEGFDMFDEMVVNIRETTVKMLFLGSFSVKRPIARPAIRPNPTASDGTYKPTARKSQKKPERNDPCPCGSGKKYKNCCGKNQA